MPVMPVAFPICTLPPGDFRWRLDQSVTSGGKPVSGPPQRGDYSAGGHWVIEHPGYEIDSREGRNTLYAIAARAAISPVMDIRWLSQPLAPWPSGQTYSVDGVPHSDGSPFSDGSLYATTSIAFTLEEALAMNATEALVRLVTGSPLIGGEPFSLRGASGYSRVHVPFSIEDAGGGLYRIIFGPDAREDYDAGAVVNFEDPVLTVTADTTADFWPTISLPYVASASMRFEEAWPEEDA